MLLDSNVTYCNHFLLVDLVLLGRSSPVHDKIADSVHVASAKPYRIRYTFSRGDPCDMRQHLDTSEAYYGSYAQQVKCMSAHALRVGPTKESAIEESARITPVRLGAALSLYTSATNGYTWFHTTCIASTPVIQTIHSPERERLPKVKTVSRSEGNNGPERVLQSERIGS